MRRYGWWVAAAVAATMGGTAALAEMEINGPADVPPPSYKGRQYVDSAGCVFVRAGYGGTVNWVPRVDRTKKQLCGYQPSLSQGAPVAAAAQTAPAPAKPAPQTTVVAAAPAPTAKPAPAPAPTVRPAKSPFAPTPFVGKPMETIATTQTPPRIGLAAPAVAKPAPLPVAAAPVRVAAMPPTRVTPALPQPAAVASAPVAPPVAAPSRAAYVSPYAMTGGLSVAAAPGPGRVAYHNTLPVPVQITGTETVAAETTACPAGTVAAQRYILSDGRSVVRCGGAARNPVDFINAAAVPGLVVTSAPMVGGTGYGASVGAMGDVPRVGAAPMIGGTGYGVSTVTPLAGGLTPQQAYAATSPYALGGATWGAPGTARVGSSGYAGEPVVVRAPSGQTTLTPVAVATVAGPTGYAPAFDDGRLNPFRGPRTAMGDAEQGVMWTNEVPSRRVTDRTPDRKRIVPADQGYVSPAAQAAPYGAAVTRVSSKSAPSAAPGAVAAGPRYVQVGTFAVAENAAAAKARLAAAGLPVSSARSGRGLTVVLAGPFPDARQALASVRGAGFADMILR